MKCLSWSVTRFSVEYPVLYSQETEVQVAYKTFPLRTLCMPGDQHNRIKHPCIMVPQDNWDDPNFGGMTEK